MQGTGYRLTAAAVCFACLLVGGLVVTPTASAAITSTNITTPTDPSFLIADFAAGNTTFSISGTSDGTTGDFVDIWCYYGTGGTLVAGGVPVNPDGSFSVPDASIGDRVCTLRAVPAGTTPVDLTPFSGPQVGGGEFDTYKVSGGPNDGQVFNAYMWAQQLTGAFDYATVGGDSGGSWGEVYDGFLFDSTLAQTTTTFYGNAGLLGVDRPTGATRSELQIDGANAYPPSVAASINNQADGLPALDSSYSVDPDTGDVVIHETDPLVTCADPTYPPDSTSCASFVSAGVTDNVTITQDHDGHVAWVTNVFSSTDGKEHSLDLLWDNNQEFGPDATQVEYQFPGEGAYSTHVVDDTVSLPASPGTVLIKVQGAADGDTSTGQGAIVYDRQATDATFTDVNGTYGRFTLHQTGTVPAGGATRFRFAYVQDYLAADVASQADAASTTFADTLLNTLSVSNAGNGTGSVSSSPAGIDCGATCSHDYEYGTPVTLTATPDAGSYFAGWSGACSGTGTCKVTTNDATSVTATFNLILPLTTTSITTPTDPLFFINDNDTGLHTFAISGTSDGSPGDSVDINCYFGTTSTTVASNVPINPDGSFSVPNATLTGDDICKLRAVPAGTSPSDLTPFTGPRIGVGERDTSTINTGPNSGTVYDYYLYAQQLTAAFDHSSLSSCGIDDGYLFDSTLAQTTTTFFCNASLFYYENPASMTRSELQIDGLNAYTPANSFYWINSDASGFPALSYSYSVDPGTGNLVIHETDPLVVCPDQTYPPTPTSCPSFVSAGVTDNRTITQDHDGHISWVSDAFTSTDGHAHTLDLLWDNSQRFQAGGDSSQLEYEFPGESGYSMHSAGDTVNLPASAPGTILVRMHGAADGDTSTGQGAIVYDRPASGASFTSVNSGDSEFTLHQTGTVPADGSTRFRSAYVQDYLAANVASLAQTAESAFLNTLSVSKAGPGSGTVSSSPGGIDCGATCSHGYGYGTSVTLTATPSTGSTFTGWSGACSGTGGCTVTTNDASAVTAHFGLAKETLTVSKSGTGHGTVTSSTGGISCGTTCSHAYDYGSSVSLTATAAAGSTFAGWSGACTGTAACRVTIKGAASVTANFKLTPEILSVTKNGDGTGTITSTPAGISCGGACDHAFDYGSSITLAAAAASGSTFSGWSGACSGKTTCTLSMNAARAAQATFVKQCVVPKLKGKTVKKAKRLLAAHDCTTGKIKHSFSTTVKKGRVISSKPKAGKHLDHLARVRLVVSKGKH